ncbi:hypothetical protein D3C86_2045170 [compost metagenome]
MSACGNYRAATLDFFRVQQVELPLRKDLFQVSIGNIVGVARQLIGHKLDDQYRFQVGPFFRFKVHHFVFKRVIHQPQ